MVIMMGAWLLRGLSKIKTQFCCCASRKELQAHSVLFHDSMLYIRRPPKSRSLSDHFPKETHSYERAFIDESTTCSCLSICRYQGRQARTCGPNLNHTCAKFKSAHMPKDVLLLISRKWILHTSICRCCIGRLLHHLMTFRFVAGDCIC